MVKSSQNSKIVRCMIFFGMLISLPSCVSNREYPTEWPALDDRRDLSGEYELSGKNNYPGNMYDSSFAIDSNEALHHLFYEDPKLISGSLKGAKMEVVDHGSSLEFILRNGEEELARRTVSDGTSDKKWSGLLSEQVSWKKEEGELERQQSIWLIFVIVNGHESDKSRFHRAADGSLVMHSKRKVLGLVLYFPFWMESSSFWTRWEPSMKE